MANLQTESLLANAKYSFLSNKYGKDPAKWKASGVATLIGADIAEGYNKWANASLKQNSIEKRQSEVRDRAEISLQNITQQKEKIQAAQTTAFIKSGVKLEGSAIDVLTETAYQAVEAQKIRQREADFEMSQMEVEKALNRARAKYAPVQTLLNIGTTATLLGVD